MRPAASTWLLCVPFAPLFASLPSYRFVVPTCKSYLSLVICWLSVYVLKASDQKVDFFSFSFVLSRRGSYEKSAFFLCVDTAIPCSFCKFFYESSRASCCLSQVCVS
uniref:Putative secreted protein n=1 Tax=Amblyomma tuberculatum TaxID=48802 RepID=A0A6M2E1U9_9ACAR